MIICIAVWHKGSIELNLDRGGFGQGYEFTWLREIALLYHKREKNTDGAAPPNTSRHHSGNITELFNNIGTRLHDDLF